MSVTDPLIKELKGYTAKFLEVLENKGVIYDCNHNFVPFCVCLEKIFNNGIISTPNSFGFIRHNDPWTWFEKLSKNEDTNYNTINVLDHVRDRKNVFTNTGRFRLALRCFLVKKSLHIPVEYVLKTGRCYKLYDRNSIMGDEILSEIFLSVLLQLSKINFKLDLGNTSFLDISWLLPEVIKVEMVPTKNLGISISFSGDKAVIVKIKSNSVCSESCKISIGDILDNLNGICICGATSGRLKSLLKCQKGVPINLSIIKAMYSKTRDIYPPIIKIFKDINLDPDVVKSKQIELLNTEIEENVTTTIKKKNSNGFKVVYIGNVDVGRNGDVKMIDKAFNVLLTPSPSYSLNKCTKLRLDVMFEVGELGVRCNDIKSGEVILQHSFMEISSCGSVIMMPNYFAYVAGEEYCNVAKHFKCFIFMTTNDELAYTILQGIGLGFQRTHFAV